MYSIFIEEDKTLLEQINLDDDMWHIHFDGSCSNEGNGVGIILVSPARKIHNLSYRLEFSYLDIIAKFKALLLGIENSINIGCGRLSVFKIFDLVVNLIHNICSPSNKLMER